MWTSLLFDPRAWGILAFVVLEAFAGYYAHHRGYLSGIAELDKYRAQQTELALRASVDRQAKEAAMKAANEKVSQDYESLKSATATAVLALDRDRLRLQQTLAAYRHSTGTDSTPTSRVDEEALVGSFSECIDRYSAVASELDQESDRLKALQEYVQKVVK